MLSITLGIYIYNNSDKDERIKFLTKEIEKKNKEIEKLIKEIKEKDKRLEEQSKEIGEKEKYIYTDEYLVKSDYYKSNNSEGSINIKFEITDTSSYRICVYGSKANNGGFGGKQCGEFYFEKGSIIEFKYEGEEARGKRGKDCGYDKGSGYNGGGLSMASFNGEILIVAGGGGGNSEGNTNKGGNFQNDGQGNFGGKGAHADEPGKAGDEYSKNGERLKGGNGGSSGDKGKYCGGGGGNGYYGGGGGG